jgi:hypothetical protein
MHFFAGWRVVAIRAAEIAMYMEKRRGERTANGTIHQRGAGALMRAAHAER